jgi:hypothetical protein
MPLAWKKHILDARFVSEGVAIADVNRDGRPDILTGNFWYEAPHWTRHAIRPCPEFDGATGYSNSFINFPMDVDGDGWPDLIVIGFPGQPAVWLENPRGGPGPWREHRIAETACNESPAFGDVNGDGRPELVFAVDESVMVWLEPAADPYAPWIAHPISEPGAPGTRKYAHGLGIGDVNGDGRAEVLCREGYWTAAADPRSGPWRWTAADFGPDCAQMHAWDVNKDGVPDVLSSSAHLKGIWWHEQQFGGDGVNWICHTIDDSWSQSHALVPADLDGDGEPEWVTGKRFWAHGPTGDIEADAPCVLYYYKRGITDGGVVWDRHLIDTDSGVGTQFQIGEVLGSGRVDIAVANKKGVFVFEQLR